MLSWLRRIAASGFVLWLGIVTLFFWKLTLTRQYLAFDDPDMAHQVLPWLNLMAAQLHRGVVALWEPHQWLGQPLAGQGQPGVMNPLQYLLLLTPRRGGFLQPPLLHAYFVFLHFAAGWMAYLLARDRGLTKTASLVCAAVFGFGGIFGQLNWPQMLSGAIWGPLVLMFAMRVVEGRQAVWNACCAGAALGLAWLSGHHQIPIFFTLMLAALLLYAWHRDGRWRFGLVGAAAFAVMFLVSAAQTLPAWEYGHQAIRWVGAPEPVGWKDAVPYNVHQQHSNPPNTLLNVLLPGIQGEISVYVGGVALLLAALGIAARWGLTAAVASAVAGGGVAYSLGAFVPLEGPFYALIPMVEKARTPAMASCVWTLGAALLCALGTDALQSPPGRLRRFAQGAMVAAALGVLPFYWRTVEGQAVPDSRWPMLALITLIAAAVVAGWQMAALRAQTAGIVALLLVLASLYSGQSHDWRHKYDPPRGFLKKIEDQRDLAAFLRQQPGPFRFMVDGNEIPYNLGDLYGLDQFDGYLASITTNVRALEAGSDRVQRLLNVRYYLAKQPFRNMKRDVFTSQSGLKVFTDDATYPRAFAVKRVLSLPSESEMQRFLSNSDSDLRTEAAMIGPVPSLQECGEAPAGSFRRIHANRIEVNIELPCRQMVVVSEAFDPSWKVTVDGRSVPLFEVDRALRGVVAGPGEHRIEMIYQPGTVYGGVVLTVASLAGLVLFRRRLQRITA